MPLKLLQWVFLLIQPIKAHSVRVIPIRFFWATGFRLTRTGSVQWLNTRSPPGRPLSRPESLTDAQPSHKRWEGKRRSRHARNGRDADLGPVRCIVDFRTRHDGSVVEWSKTLTAQVPTSSSASLSALSQAEYSETCIVSSARRILQRKQTAAIRTAMV